MLKSRLLCLFFGLFVIPLNGFAQSSYMSSGSVNQSSGTPDKDLRYEEFRITEDGYITGYIVNASNGNRSGIQLDMWTTNMQETRIAWRKKLNIGDLGPHARYLVKEPYTVDTIEPSRTKFMFRFTSGANFRNK